MNKELCWMILPITGLLSQFGGTWWKAYRRYFIPIIAIAAVWVFTGYLYYGYLLMGLHLYACYTLPITLIGDSIPEHPVNQLWIPLWGILLCSSILWVHLAYWFICVVFGLLLAILVFLSNWKPSAQYFQWKFVEMFEGILPLVPLMYFITLQP